MYPECWKEILKEFESGADLTRISGMPFIVLREGNRLRKGIDQFFANQFLPRYILECDQQELVYELSKSGAGAGLLSPVIFYQYVNEMYSEENPFYVFPIVNEIQENTMYLVYRDDYPLPQYAMDFIRDASLVFRSYTRLMNQHFQSK